MLVPRHGARAWPRWAGEARASRHVGGVFGALFAVLLPYRLGFFALSACFIGGRYRDRTCDPFHVKEVLYR